MTVLQARAAGVPIIACDVPGIREVLEDGVHGKLCPIGDSMALANAMRDVILRKMKRTGHFDLPVTLDEHLDRIEEVYSTVQLVDSVPAQ